MSVKYDTNNTAHHNMNNSSHSLPARKAARWAHEHVQFWHNCRLVHQTSAGSTLKVCDDDDVAHNQTTGKKYKQVA